MESHVIQNLPLNKLVADSILEAAIDLRTTAVTVEQLKNLQLAFPVNEELCHPAIEAHQNHTGVLQGPHEAADELVGDSLCEPLESKSRVEWTFAPRLANLL